MPGGLLRVDPERGFTPPPKGQGLGPPNGSIKALAEDELMIIAHKVKFDENHFTRRSVVFGQWFKTDKPKKREL